VTNAKIATGAVTNPKLKNSTITGLKVKDDSLTGADIQEATLGKVPSAQNADHATTADTATSATTAGKAAPTGPAGGGLAGSYPNPSIGTNAVGSAQIQAAAVRASDLGTITTVTNTVGGILTGGVGSVTATCPAGTLVISGGGQPTFFGVEMTSSLKSGNGWLYQAKNNSGSTTSLTAFAYCLSA
jgi:hypothetical protein